MIIINLKRDHFSGSRIKMRSFSCRKAFFSMIFLICRFRNSNQCHNFYCNYCNDNNHDSDSWVTCGRRLRKTSSGNWRLTLFWIACSGLFYNQVTYTSGSGPIGVAAVDANNGSKPDIIVTNSGANNVSVLLNAGNGTFLPPTTYSTGPGPHTVTVADLNSDHLIDIIVTTPGSNSVTILLNAGGGTFSPQTACSAGPYPQRPAIADVNGEKKPDMIVSDFNSDYVGVYLHR